MCSSLSAAVVFSQNFSAGGNVASYVGSGLNQFETYNDGTPDNVISVTGNQLVFDRTATGGNSGMLRIGSTGMSGSITTGFTFTADISLVSWTSASSTIISTTAGFLQYGNQQGSTARFDAVSNNATNYWLTASGAANAGNTWGQSGTKTITWVVNNTGSNYTYVAPDASSKTLATGTYDLWIGTGSSGQRLDVGYSVNASGFNSIQFGLPNWPSSIASFGLDSIQISDLAAVPEPSSMLLLGLGGVALVAFRRLRRA